MKTNLIALLIKSIIHRLIFNSINFIQLHLFWKGVEAGFVCKDTESIFHPHVNRNFKKVERTYTHSK